MLSSLKGLNKQHCNPLVPECSVGCIPLLMHFFLFLFSWQTKDLPVQPERPSYPAPLFLSPCVSYGGCGMVLHCPDPRVHPVPLRAQKQQEQHSVRFPPSPVWVTRTLIFSQQGEHRCHHTAILSSNWICAFLVLLFNPDQDRIYFGKYSLSVTALRRKPGFFYICLLIKKKKWLFDWSLPDFLV